MKKRYTDCQSESGNCAACSLSSYGRDCHNMPINQIAYFRIKNGFTQAELSRRSSVNIRQIQKIERGDIDVGNLSLRNAIALAAALDIPVEELLQNRSCEADEL